MSQLLGSSVSAGGYSDAGAYGADSYNLGTTGYGPNPTMSAGGGFDWGAAGKAAAGQYATSVGGGLGNPKKPEQQSPRHLPVTPVMMNPSIPMRQSGNDGAGGALELFRMLFGG